MREPRLLRRFTVLLELFQFEFRWWKIAAIMSEITC
jgi:hypothetical protein